MRTIYTQRAAPVTSVTGAAETVKKPRCKGKRPGSGGVRGGKARLEYNQTPSEKLALSSFSGTAFYPLAKCSAAEAQSKKSDLDFFDKQNRAGDFGHRRGSVFPRAAPVPPVILRPQAEESPGQGRALRTGGSFADAQDDRWSNACHSEAGGRRISRTEALGPVTGGRLPPLRLGPPTDAGQTAPAVIPGRAAAKNPPPDKY